MKSAALKHQHHRSPAGSTRGSVCRRLTEHGYHGEGASAHTQTHTVSHTHTLNVQQSVPFPPDNQYFTGTVESSCSYGSILLATGPFRLFCHGLFPRIATAAISSQPEHGNFLHLRRVRLGICAVSCTLSPCTSSGQLPAQGLSCGVEVM